MSPIGPFKDFAACVAANKDKKSPGGYCAAIERKIKGEALPGDNEILEEDPFLDDDVDVTTFFDTIMERVIGQSAKVEKVSKTDVNYTVATSPSQCSECRYWLTNSCSVVAGDIKAGDTCDAFSPAKYNKQYIIVDAEHFIKGLMVDKPLNISVLGGIETPIGKLILFEDNRGPEGHRYSMKFEEFIDVTASRHGWIDADAADIEQAGAAVKD